MKHIILSVLVLALLTYWSISAPQTEQALPNSASSTPSPCKYNITKTTDEFSLLSCTYQIMPDKSLVTNLTYNTTNDGAGAKAKTVIFSFADKPEWLTAQSLDSANHRLGQIITVTHRQDEWMYQVGKTQIVSLTYLTTTKLGFTFPILASGSAQEQTDEEEEQWLQRKGYEK